MEPGGYNNSLMAHTQCQGLGQEGGNLGLPQLLGMHIKSQTKWQKTSETVFSSIFNTLSDGVPSFAFSVTFKNQWFHTFLS